MDGATCYEWIKDAVGYADNMRGEYPHLLIEIVPEVYHIRVSGVIISDTAHNRHAQLPWVLFESAKDNLLIVEVDRIANALKPHHHTR